MQPTLDVRSAGFDGRQLMNRHTVDPALQALFERGLALHQQGRLDDAKGCYEQILAVDPGHFDALHMLGVFCIQTRQAAIGAELISGAIAVKPDLAAAHGNLATALNSLDRHAEALAASERAIGLDPGFAEAHGNRAQALHKLGRQAEALASYDRVIALKPTAQAWYNRAAVLRELGRLEDALASYDRALALNPNDPLAHRGRGVTLYDLDLLEAALESCDRALELNPNYPGAHCARGAVLRNLGRPQDAAESYGRAIALAPDYAEAFNNLGNVLTDLKGYNEALSNFDRAIALQPDYAEAWNNRVVPLCELDRHEEALESADRAVALDPANADAHSNRGSTLARMRRLEEALASFEQAIALRPAVAKHHDNRGMVLYELGRLDEAMTSFDRALALKPDLADAQFNQAICRLKLGDFTKGFEQLEWRWKTELFRAGRRDLGATLWLGDADVAGRTILLRCEQGSGDTLQFCRYVSDVAALGGAIVLEVQPGLERLLKRLQGAAQVVTLQQPLPPFEYQTPLMSLPHAVRAPPERLYGRYLESDPEDAAAWAARLGPSGKLRVGLCWAGGALPTAMDRRRSLPLEAFSPLAGIGGVELYSLQKGPPALQLSEAAEDGWARSSIADLTSDLKDFADTAALIDNLDLVIACDTAVAHLAGGMGKPVWILNRIDACWRWGVGRADSPWYPTARLFTQSVQGDWAGVVDQVAGELARLVEAREG